MNLSAFSGLSSSSYKVTKTVPPMLSDFSEHRLSLLHQQEASEDLRFPLPTWLLTPNKDIKNP